MIERKDDTGARYWEPTDEKDKTILRLIPGGKFSNTRFPSGWVSPKGEQVAKDGLLYEVTEDPDDTIARLRARLASVGAELVRVERDRECLRRTNRENWQAICAMRDTINEHVPLPSIDSGPLMTPETSPILASLAEVVAARIMWFQNRAEAAEAALATAEADALREAATMGHAHADIHTRDAVRRAILALIPQ